MSLTRVVAVSKAPHIHELARQVGREVYAADNIIEAYEIVQAASPELILLESEQSCPITLRALPEACIDGTIW